MSVYGPQWSLLLCLDMAFCSHYEVRQALMEGQHSKAQDEETSPGLDKEPMTEWPLHPGTVPAQAQRWSVPLGRGDEGQVDVLFCPMSQTLLTTYKLFILT